VYARVRGRERGKESRREKEGEVMEGGEREGINMFLIYNFIVFKIYLSLGNQHRNMVRAHKACSKATRLFLTKS